MPSPETRRVLGHLKDWRREVGRAGGARQFSGGPRQVSRRRSVVGWPECGEEIHLIRKFLKIRWCHPSKLIRTRADRWLWRKIRPCSRKKKTKNKTLFTVKIMCFWWVFVRPVNEIFSQVILYFSLF